MRVIRQINRGGFGIVEEVAHKGQQFARKTFDPTPLLGINPEEREKARRRFIREVRMQKELKHPHIMPILEAGLDSDPPWFLMPLAEGDYTIQIEKDKNAGKVELEPLLHILSGLEEVHRLGYVHRDLKPQNVLWLDGKFVLSDFGLVLPLLRNTTMLTSTHSAWGTQAYAAPELVQNFRTAPPQADFYSFGCILHDIVGSSTRIPYSQVSAQGPLGPVIERCSATNPIDRFADVAALRSALVVALVSPMSTAQAPKIQEWINSLVNEPTSITAENYEEIARYIERDAEPANSVALLYAFDIVQIEHLHQSFSHLFGRLIPLVCKWIRTDSFEFAYCDVLGSRLAKIYEIGSIREKAESAIAALELGYNHNRFSVMRRFFRMIDQAIGQDLADRLAIDLAAMGRGALLKIEEIERQVAANRDEMHPKIQMILKELKNQYESQEDA